MNKIFPQAEVNGKAAAGTDVLPGDEGKGQGAVPCRISPAGATPLCCSRPGACLSAFLLLLLATLAALIALVTIFGSPPRTPVAQACVTLTNRTGFLCHDRRSCISASSVCDGVRTCPHGEDEDETLCRDVPQSLPQFLVARCGDPASWIYSDQRCDGTNHCGDCSDELIPGKQGQQSTHARWDGVWGAMAGVRVGECPGHSRAPQLLFCRLLFLQ
ncbi:low-density lipoprotein receptor class A domain-containing protein 1 isoform X2 [Artibeus jamaicensis]|uniref:low-density lipoprotein receptor class A domain-containing protein 1 isoform X2 n=1 Tax=Artibeus jamaicensis TaxID=9417 RepID=UPI00235A4DE6|nr:low-density lipoprotein receptor class A domain-containing protein 1 isoform X2 [Artibeus jamaicensis]